MILGLLRAGLMAFVILTVVYLLVSVYSRSVRREKLEKEFDALAAEPPMEGTSPADRDAYIEAGLQAYRGSLRRKLIWLVYIIPMAVVISTVYYVNH
jgi:Ca2+/Na+ antiporter